MMGWSPRCYIPSFVKIGLPVLEKIFEGFLPYMGVAANLALIGQAVSEKKMFKIVDDVRRTDAGAFKYTISSPR